MFDIIRENPRKSVLILLIPALVAAVYLLLVVRYTMAQNDGNIGALLDDTWIHIRFAHNIAAGEGLSYNEGVLTTGATSPLWVIVLAGALTVVNPPLMQEINVAIVLSAVGHIAAVMAISGFGYWLTRQAWIGLLAGVFTALTGRFVWMGLSGMEITTFTALCVLALWSHAADIRAGRAFGWRTGILVALATLARPEGYLLALLIGVDAVIIAPLWGRMSRAEWWRRARAAWRGVVAYVLLAGSYPLVCLLISGYPLPNTFRVKSMLGREYPELPRAFFWQPNVDYGALVTALAAVGCVYLLWRVYQRLEPIIPLAVPLWAPGFVLAVLFMGADRFVVNNSRYVAPAIPFHALFAAVGLWLLIEFAARRLPQLAQPRPKSVTLGAAAILTLGFVFTLGSDQGAGVARAVGQLRQMHVAAGEWFAQNTDPGQTIALNDVGAIVHISDRPVLDLVGLVSEEVIDITADTAQYTCEHDLQLMRLMMVEQPILIGVFPWWYPCMTGWEGILQPFNVFEITGETVIAGGELVVYFPQWENWPLQLALPDDVIPMDAAFEGGITLAGYTLQTTDSGLDVTLWWEVSATPDRDYNIFVQPLDAEGEITAPQGDSPPQQGRFPTSLWRAGDLIPSTHSIAADVDTIATIESLRVGFYVLDGSRPPLQRTDADGDSALLPVE